MLRFVPDNWLDGLLRPLVMADSAAGVYIEIHAPDWRFLIFAVALPVIAWVSRGTALIVRYQWQSIIGLVICFYVWTFVSGNGRYFFWGLVAIGPLLVLVLRHLPVSTSLRNTAIAMAVVLQVLAVKMTHETNVWALRPWVGQGEADVPDTAFRHKPAVLMTLGSISHSILVPQFHPDSRWTNIGGQLDLTPEMLEYQRLRELLADPLPKFVVVRANHLVMREDSQPIEPAWRLIRRALSRYALAPTGAPCTFLPTSLGGMPFRMTEGREVRSGFWVCEITSIGPLPTTRETQAFAPELDVVFERIEARCPRQFPSGNAVSKPSDAGVTRQYSRSDAAIVVTEDGAVYLKHMRALNPTVLGTVDQIRSNQFQLLCDRLPGRYVPPWARGSENDDTKH